MANKNQYILFNGIELSAGTSIINCHIENLDQDPPIIESAGRIWYNSSEKNFKYSTLDSSDNYTIQVFPDFSELATFINSLASTSSGEGSNLVGYEGIVTTSVTIPPTTIKNAVDILAQEIDIIKNNQGINGLISVDEFIIQEDGESQLQLSKISTSKNSLTVLINGLIQYDDDYILETVNNISTISLSNLFIDDKIRVINFEL